MDKRKILARVVITFSAMALFLMLVPFVQSMMPSEAAVSKYIKDVDISNIKQGTYLEFRWNHLPVVIYRPGEKGHLKLVGNNKLVWGPEISESDTTQLYVYLPVSTFLGCKLQDTKKLSGSTSLPPGWYDPCHMGVWDYAGRLYKDIHLPKGKILESLKSIPYQHISKNVIRIRK